MNSKISHLSRVDILRRGFIIIATFVILFPYVTDSIIISIYRLQEFGAEANSDVQHIEDVNISIKLKHDWIYIKQIVLTEYATTINYEMIPVNPLKSELTSNAILLMNNQGEELSPTTGIAKLLFTREFGQRSFEAIPSDQDRLVLGISHYGQVIKKEIEIHR
ncbi:hypothetical protein [Oceanobacillus sp. 1P07AA]|uniref:hypothetical protein n=1 Tax=Oceanobacillus sp. 1P07AA TaxID=3132293 RepID=UPI0039A5F9EA